jgi:opacity protein-like surface antigen
VATDSFDTAQGIAGLRVDLSDWTSLKAEYRYTRILDRSETTHEGILNWSWGF